MINKLNSINPLTSASVSASAGTGKTWMLVSRLIRLLLAGARPEGILAVTFTRKAAGEMQMRLNSRLLELAQCSSQQLDSYLTQIGVVIDDVSRKQARTLYETLLSSPVTVKTTTFHAFCQDILRRFPLEAGIPPGFELLEATAEFQQAAWDALCTEASLHPEKDQAQALETLFETCGSLDNTRSALNDFLNHRSDWWAFTEGQTDPLSFAIDTLAAQLDISPEDNPQATFFTGSILQTLNEFCVLLQKHDTATNQKHLLALSTACKLEQDEATRFDAVCSAFLTQNGSPLARKESKAQAKSMGDAGQQHFLEIHQQMSAAITEIRDKIAAQRSWQRSSAWYQAGLALLQHFQRIKAEQRKLDFADLEWQAYRLLNHGSNVHWIQYKLDQRIDHLLIDEFQDTNPTQWRLILPLLQELAAGENERQRTVFLVGDNKQSIYRFRRADPELFDAAQDWLHENLNAVTQPLDTSWRSAAAIMDFVNRVFDSDDLKQHLMHFHAHQTHHQELWGQVEILPLIETTEPDQPLAREGLRNPLKIPRELYSDQRHLEEGRQIAAKIQQLIAEQTPIGPPDQARPITYQDIMILVRNRTHAADYEQALRAAGIPFTSANRGTLLESQEAKDLVNLLELLLAPFNNLALASLLRSPIFNCSHDDLIALAKIPDGLWIERLASLATQQSADTALHRAHQLLSQWRILVDTLPVHDLLDRIFCQADVLRRYQAAYPIHLQHRVLANLTRFIELALEVDSGRYPTIGHFVQRLRSLRQQDQGAPDEGLPTQAESRVRVMTIHAAKGLESAVLFLADCTNTHQGKTAYRAMVEWPAQSKQPDYFLLAGKKNELDSFSQSILERQAKSETREDANLFYVAVTRAQQLLFISGCRPTRGDKLGWYGVAESCLREELETQDPLMIASGNKPATSALVETATKSAPAIDPRLNQPIHADSPNTSINPSQTNEYPEALRQSSPVGSDQQTRGIVIHRMLELLCEGEAQENILNNVASEFGLSMDSPELRAWHAEAEATFNHPQLKHLFDAQHFQQAFNEVPIYYQRGSHTVHGIIDRIILTEDEAWVIDYKTHPITQHPEVIQPLVDDYKKQLQLYSEGAGRLWPQKNIRAGLLFTSNQSLAMV